MCVRPGLVLDAAVQRTNKSFPFDVIFSIPSTTERKERDDWEGGRIPPNFCRVRYCVRSANPLPFVCVCVTLCECREKVLK